jgi:outer membrane protein OmpA-like peptidoglycan-associated protein
MAMNRGFWLILAAVVVVAISWFLWPTANQTPQAPATAQAPAATPPVQPTVNESAGTASAPQAPAPAPAAAPSAQVAEKEAAPAKGAQTTEKPAPAPPAPAPAGAAPADTKEAAAPSPAPAPSPAAPAAPAAPAEEKTAASSDTDAGPHANDKASAELASLLPGFVPKDLVAALNDSVISFASGGAEVPASMTDFLQKAAADLKQLPKGHVVEVAGYTDSTGDEAFNVALSQRRAEAVREALVKFGADPDMLIAKGYGSADPIASNDTPEGRRRNRRIEYHIVKTP